MPFNDFLLPEFDHEMGTTRRLLERVPTSALGWKPHAKSMSLGQLSDHLSKLTSWVNLILATTRYDLATIDPTFRLTDPVSTEAVVQAFDTSVKAARADMTARTDAEIPGVVDAQTRRARGVHHAAIQRPAQLRAESHDSPSRAVERLPSIERRGAAVDLRPHRR